MALTIIETARRIFKDNLQLGPGDSYLFFTDTNSRWEDAKLQIRANREYLHGVYEAFLSLADEFPHGRCDKYESTQRHGAEPRENIWRLAFGERIYSWLVDKDILWRLKEGADISKEEDQEIRDVLSGFHDDIVKCVIAFPWYSSTHTRFRRLLNQEHCRYISMPMLTQSVMEGPMTADWADVSARTQRVGAILRELESLSVTCPYGTQLQLQIGSKDLIHLDTGDFSKPGAFGNLPAGESYFVPKRGSVQGHIVFTSGPEKPHIEPTHAIVERGRISGFESVTDYSKQLEEKFTRDTGMRHIAEFGVGTNPLARDVSNMIEGEKICGTVHVAIGSDKGIGGEIEASEHLDHIIVAPTLTGTTHDGTQVLIIDNGHLLI